MKMKLITACVLAACGVVPPAFAAGAVDLASCCTPGDKDFPKVGGNLGNQNYSSLRQINRGNINKLGGAWVNRIEGGLTTGTNQSTAVAVDGVIYIESALGNVIAVDGKTGVTKWKSTTTYGDTHAPRRRRARDLGLGVHARPRQPPDRAEQGHRRGRVGDAVPEPDRPDYVGNVEKVALVYHDKRLYVGTNDGNRGAALSMDATNGDVLTHVLRRAAARRVRQRHLGRRP